MKEKYIPKVGDTVKLLKSKVNWATDEECGDGEISMDAILEQTPIVIITAVEDDEYSDGEYNIRFDNDGGWQWTTANKHFKLYKPTIKSNKSHNKALIKLLKNV